MLSYLDTHGTVSVVTFIYLFLVSMLSEMGIETGVDLPALLAAAADVREVLGR